MGTTEKGDKHLIYTDRVEIEKNASADTKILAKAFIEYSKDGVITTDERNKLKKLDEALKDVDFAVLTNDLALIDEVNTDKAYSVLSDKLEKTNALNKPKRTR